MSCGASGCPRLPGSGSPGLTKRVAMFFGQIGHRRSKIEGPGAVLGSSSLLSGSISHMVHGYTVIHRYGILVAMKPNLTMAHRPRQVLIDCSNGASDYGNKHWGPRDGSFPWGPWWSRPSYSHDGK